MLKISDTLKIRQRMADTIEKAKAEDPKELRRQIIELKAALKKSASVTLDVAQRQLSQPIKTVTVHEKVPAIKDSQIKRLEKLFDKVIKERNRHYKAMVIMQDLNDLAGVLTKVISSVSMAQKPCIPDRPILKIDRAVFHKPLEPGVIVKLDGSLTKGERAILTVVCQYPNGASREQITVLTGYKRSSRDTYLQRLCNKGFISS